VTGRVRPSPEDQQYRLRTHPDKLKVIKLLWERDGGGCWFCDEDFMLLDDIINLPTWQLKAGLPDNYPTIDHYHPRSLGGTNHLSNLVLACQACNARKADSLPDEDWESNDRVRPEDIEMFSTRMVKCHNCDGSGKNHRGDRSCQTCGGKGGLTLREMAALYHTVSKKVTVLNRSKNRQRREIARLRDYMVELFGPEAAKDRRALLRSIDSQHRTIVRLRAMLAEAMDRLGTKVDNG